MTKRLIKIIGKEAALFETFLEALDKQQAMLVANDMDGLNLVTELVREKLVESQILGKQREEEIERIRQANAIEGDLNVSQLLDMVDEEQASRLQELRTLISSLHDKITHSRNQNAMLINKSRDSIARMMEMLSRVNKPDTTYARKGCMVGAGENVAIDRRA